MNTLLTIILLFAGLSLGFDRNVGAYVGAASALYVGMEHLMFVCYRYECCAVGSSKVHWIRNDYKKLEMLLEDKLFGQHIASKILNQQLAGYLIEEKPKKPFVIHVSGKTGTGKNHIANLIAQARYSEGINSKYVLKIIGTHKLAHLETQIAQHIIRTMISEHVSKCKHSMIIIDESEKLPNGTLNAISPFLDNNVQVDGVDYRYSIFVFLSNTAGNTIRDYVAKQLENGYKREDITVHEMESLIQNHLYREGELRQSSLISRYQLDAFIPMLPLEKRHVQQCAQDELIQRNNKCGCGTDKTCITTKSQEISNEVDYTGLFSRSGCKKILTKANLLCPLDVKKEL